MKFVICPGRALTVFWCLAYFSYLIPALAYAISRRHCEGVIMTAAISEFMDWVLAEIAATPACA